MCVIDSGMRFQSLSPIGNHFGCFPPHRKMFFLALGLKRYFFSPGRVCIFLLKHKKTALCEQNVFGVE